MLVGIDGSGVLKIGFDYAGIVRTGIGWNRMNQSTEDWS